MRTRAMLLVSLLLVLASWAFAQEEGQTTGKVITVGEGRVVVGLYKSHSSYHVSMISEVIL